MRDKVAGAGGGGCGNPVVGSLDSKLARHRARRQLAAVSPIYSPSLTLPTRCCAGFLNKRHYNLKDSEVDAHLRPQWQAAIEKLYKGSYETYRYVDLGA